MHEFITCDRLIVICYNVLAMNIFVNKLLSMDIARQYTEVLYTLGTLHDSCTKITISRTLLYHKLRSVTVFQFQVVELER